MTKILVIEDEQPLREDILETLECLFFDSVGATNGREGVELAQKHLPDLIICDIMMPEIDGYGVFNTLRHLPATAKIPFIFLSAKADKTDIRQGMNLGAEDYLTKPFTIAELRDAIATQLEKREKSKRESQEKVDELRTNITRSLPHELRTPLQGILSLSEMLLTQNDGLAAETRQKMLYEINQSGHRLYKLIQNFLIYAETEIMAFDIERLQELQNSVTIYCKRLVTDVAEQKARMMQREADLHLALEDASVKISDINLQKIIEELIDNAFKFSSPGTPVKIESTVKQDNFILSVSDRGSGLTAEQIANVGAYMQFDRKLYEQQGTGLGLIIAKRLTELHGGEIMIESEPEKQTKIQLILPLASE